MKLLKWIFYKPRYIMSVYKDDNGNLHGGTIHIDDGKSYVDNVSHINNPEYLGQTIINFK